MRIAVLTIAVLAVGARGGHACPPRQACVVQSHSPASETAAADGATLPTAAPPRARADGAEMPWIWRELRDRVYARMPTYKPRNALEVVLAPVVVRSPGDTVPGVGIEGRF